MIEDALVNYGVLGLWTISLLTERYFNNNKMKVVVDNNTTALTKVYEVMQKCKHK
jgi:hypothetical protein